LSPRKSSPQLNKMPDSRKSAAKESLAASSLYV
jgi:hypothetical protein